MVIPQRGSKTFDVLYSGDDGEEIGLDEVQLLDDPSSERIDELEKLLIDESAFIRFQATLVLTAWGHDGGMRSAEKMIAERGADGENLSPNRLNGQDNRFDDLAEAIHLYLLSGGDQQRAFDAFKALLNMYADAFFESKLKRALLKHANADLLAAVKEAILQCLEVGKTYQASQLLPVVAKLEPKRCWSLLLRFTALPTQTPDPAVNVAEALRYIPGVESDQMLTAYLSHDGAGVASQAQESLSFKQD